MKVMCFDFFISGFAIASGGSIYVISGDKVGLLFVAFGVISGLVALWILNESQKTMKWLDNTFKEVEENKIDDTYFLE